MERRTTRSNDQQSADFEARVIEEGRERGKPAQKSEPQKRARKKPKRREVLKPSERARKVKRSER
jgi:hypothetical protein